MTLVLLALAGAVQPGVVRAQGSGIAFDAIFYRARPAFNYCYAFQGVVGYSLRPLSDADRITHDPDNVPCPVLAPGSAAAMATADCPNCQADCTSFVRKAWNSQAVRDGHAETSQSLLQRDTPDACRAANGDTSFERLVDMTKPLTQIVGDLRTLRPGDDCENSHHSILLVASRGGNHWSTWEAKGAAKGILRLDDDLLDKFLYQVTPDDCHTGIAGNGCWRPPTVRTGPPTLFLPADGTTIEQPSDLVFKFQRPAQFPAIADYLLWLRWDENEGTDKDPDIRHLVTRIPAFTERWSDVSVRLADFPNVADGEDCGPGGPTGQTCPRDVVAAGIMEVPGDRLSGAQIVRPLRFKPENEGQISADWSTGLVPCIPTLSNDPVSPAARPAEAQCGVEQPSDTIVRTGITYHWRVRVERYAEPIPNSFRRRTAVGRCHLDPATKLEQDEVCKDPLWSPEFTFKIKPVYTLSGSTDEISSFGVDDDLDVYLNDAQIYTDGNALSGVRAPIMFEAKKGDRLRLVVRDTYGHCAGLQAINLIDNADNHVQVTPGFNLGCGRPAGNQGVVFDQTFVIPF